MARKLTLLDKLMRVPAIKEPAAFLASSLTSVEALRRGIHYGIRKGYIKRRVWEFLPVNLEFEIVLPAGESFKYSSVHGDGVGKMLYWQGLTWFGGEFSVFLNCLRELADIPGLILDIGANTGIYSLIACAKNPAAKVVAVEPVPHVYNRLAHNIKINHFENRCQTLQYAVSDFLGTAKFLVPLGHVPQEGTLDMTDERVPGYETIEINTTTVDSLCRDEDVTVVKIDVEGLEHKVISGMSETLACARPAIIIEHHPNCPAFSIEPLLSKFDYQIFHICDGGTLVPVTGFKTGVRQHFLCTASEKNFLKSFVR